MPSLMELQPCDRFEWERIVRRITGLGAATKCVAFAMAQFGDQHGRNIRPGEPRLAAVCEMGESTVRRHLARLRALGLLVRTTNGGGSNRLAATYRLTVPEDLLERVVLLGPDERTPLTQVSGVTPVDNSVLRSPERAEFEAFGEQNSAHFGENSAHFTGTSPLTQVSTHQETTQLHHPYSVTSLPHLRCGYQRDQPDHDQPADPAAERRRQHADLEARYPEETRPA